MACGSSHSHMSEGCIRVEARTRRPKAFGICNNHVTLSVQGRAAAPVDETIAVQRHPRGGAGDDAPLSVTASLVWSTTACGALAVIFDPRGSLNVTRALRNMERISFWGPLLSYELASRS